MEGIGVKRDKVKGRQVMSDPLSGRVVGGMSQVASNFVADKISASVSMRRRIAWAQIIAIGAIVVTSAACDRKLHEQGGKAPTAGASDAVNDSVPTSGLARVSNVAEVAPNAGGSARTGQQIYTQVCGACHQPTGQGVPGAFPPLDGSGYVNSPNIERAASILLYGLTGPIKVHGTTFAGAMPPQGAVLKDEELALVLSYVRSSWSNKSGPVEPTVFVKMREKWGQRGPFTIEELGVESTEQ